MVLLTLTPDAVRAIKTAERIAPDEHAELERSDDPSLIDPKPGNPISHRQLIELSKLLKRHAARTSIAPENSTQTESQEQSSESVTLSVLPTTLDALLRGTAIYIPPPPPRKEPTPEYKALMARLRAEEEARVYQRMVNPDPFAKSETFSQRFPSASAPFSLSTPYDPIEDDDLSYEEVHRQLVLIINVLVSIVACAVFIWVAARHWSVPKRLGLSMGGSGAVAIAEVVVYSGYMRRAQEAKKKEKKKPEKKKIMHSWVIDGSSRDSSNVSTATDRGEDGIRYRKGKHR